MLLEDIFPKSRTKFIEVVRKYSVVNFVPGLRMRDRVEMVCSDCNHVFIQRANNIFSQGIISCKCSKSYRRTKDELLQDTLKTAGVLNLSLVSVDFKKPLCESLIELRCKKCSGSFIKTFENLYYTNSGCIYCSERYQPTAEEYKFKIEDRLGNDFKLISSLGERPSKNSLISVECLSCNKTSSKRIAAVIYNEPSCPHCAGYGYNQGNTGFLYLIKLFDQQSEYYKIGITGNLKRRFRELSYNNGLSLEVLSTWEYKSGEPILEHENFLKQNFALGRLVDKPFEDGYTEIVHKEHLPMILTVQNLQYRNTRSGFSS